MGFLLSHGIRIFQWIIDHFYVEDFASDTISVTSVGMLNSMIFSEL